MDADFYTVLGVARTASSDDIKRAFRRIARSCHPDVAKDDPVAEARFMEARKAYETLKDPLARAVYDNGGVSPPRQGPSFDAFWRATERRQRAEGRRPKAGRSGLGDPANAVSLDDLVGDFQTVNVTGQAGAGPRDAGTAAGAHPRNSGTAASASPRESGESGEPEQRELEISVVVALRGGSVAIDTPQGAVAVTVPPGSSGGTRLRLRGKGGTPAEPRDLIVTVKIVVPKRLTAEARVLVEQLSTLPEFD